MATENLSSSTLSPDQARKLDEGLASAAAKRTEGVSKGALSGEKGDASPRISQASATPPSAAKTTKIPIEIGGKEYLMTVFIGDKAVEFSDQTQIDKVKKLALKVFEGVDIKDTTIKSISDKGIVDITGKSVYTFKENVNWDTFKREIRTINQPSSTNVQANFEKATEEENERSPSTSPRKPEGDDKTSSAQASPAETEEQQSPALTEEEKQNLRDDSLFGSLS